MLTQLEEALETQGRAALSGLGGVGKTQTAVQFAHHRLAEYDYMFWTVADSSDSIVSGYGKIAALLKLPEFTSNEETLAEDAVKHEEMLAADAVKRWMRSNRRWLIIFDNADTPDIVKPFLPPGPTGHILLTSRASVFDTIEIVKPVELNEMSPAEARTFLLKRTGRESEVGLESNAASKLVEELGFLPLALEQAGAHILRNKSLFQDYLKSFRNRRLELLNKYSPVAGDYRETIRTTWSINFRQLEKESEAAADLLRLSAFLSPDSIPLEFLAAGAPELGDPLSAALDNVQEDPFVLDEALAPLTRFSLIRRQIATRFYSVHRLVQEVVCAEMDKATQRLWAERAVRAVDRAFPNVEFSNWTACDRLLSQAQACARLILRWGFEFAESGRLLSKAGWYLYERGRYTDSRPLLEKALTIWETLSPEQPEIATSLNNLARLYYKEGHYAKAVPLLERALAIWKNTQRLNDPEMATSLDTLARLYYKQGQSTKAEPLYEQALSIREKTLGPEHPEVAHSLNNFGGLYRDQGQNAKAECAYERALVILVKTRGTEHPDVAASLSRLAVLYYNQGQNTKAEPLFEQVLSIREKTLGSDHPDVARTLNNLARLYFSQGHYPKAEPLFKRAVAILEKILDPEHPDVARCLENHALCLRSMGHSREAEPLAARARAIRAKNA